MARVMGVFIGNIEFRDSFGRPKVFFHPLVVINFAFQHLLRSTYASPGKIFTFGNNAGYQNYETICGGAGAGPDYDGTDAIHTHMTNTLATDPEILEWRFPVVLESFSIREDSGGAGKYRGGNGIIRRVRFEEAMIAAVVSGHRRVPPFGVAGGAPGKCGRNYVERAGGTITELDGTDGVEMLPGDVFVIETPGGGGYGQS